MANTWEHSSHTRSTPDGNDDMQQNASHVPHAGGGYGRHESNKRPEGRDGQDGLQGHIADDNVRATGTIRHVNSVAYDAYGTRGTRPDAPDVEAAPPEIVPGSGVSMGNPFIRRRDRPLTMRLAMLTLAACIVVSGLFAVTPLGTSAEGDLTPFQALAGAVVLHHEISYHWYTAQWGDTIEGIAAKQHVQIGGIYKLNNMYAGQEIGVGISYKIPDDPYFGKDYRPAPMVTRGNGSTRYGTNWWNAVAGDPNPETPCAPDGGSNPLGYHFVGPNPGSDWIRGFSYFHNGVDIAAPEGNPIHAAQNGEVIWAGYDATNGFGWSVVINHCHHLGTLYGHMDGIRVHIGQSVHAGDIIGIEGSTGTFTTGPHLHFGVFWNTYLGFTDPLPFFGNSTYNITH